MRTISQPSELQDYTLECRQKGLSVGFIPTMGALHEGHISLIREARKSTDIVVVSIFVNPTQFNDPEDFKKYPATLKEDLNLLMIENVSVVFTPQSEDIYSDDKRFSIAETTHHLDLCGKTRAGHFNGVLTVVLKLLQIVQPTRMFMGEKDYQQLQLIRDMVTAFFIPTEVVACPTVRDSFGLALSSRNTRLTESGIKKAQLFANTLRTENSLKAISEKLKSNNIRVDYLEEKWDRRFAAVFIDDVRLIDNVPQ